MLRSILFIKSHLLLNTCPTSSPPTMWTISLYFFRNPFTIWARYSPSITIHRAMLHTSQMTPLELKSLTSTSLAFRVALTSGRCGRGSTAIMPTLLVVQSMSAGSRMVILSRLRSVICSAVVQYLEKYIFQYSWIFYKDTCDSNGLKEILET